MTVGLCSVQLRALFFHVALYTSNAHSSQKNSSVSKSLDCSTCLSCHVVMEHIASRDDNSSMQHDPKKQHVFVVVTCFSTFLQRAHFTCESFLLLLSLRCTLKVLSLFGVFLAQHRFVLNGWPTVTLQNGATDSASVCEVCNRIDEAITCSIVWNRGCADRFDSHVFDGQHCDSLLGALRWKQQSVTNVCDLCDSPSLAAVVFVFSALCSSSLSKSLSVSSSSSSSSKPKQRMLSSQSIISSHLLLANCTSEC